MIANLVTELSYLFNRKFSTVGFLIAYSAICASKVIITCTIIFYLLVRKVFGKTPQGYNFEIDL